VTTSAAETDVVQILSDLLRIDTTNPGKPERPAAELVAGLLDAVGVHCEIFEGEPGRSNVIARIEGANPDRPALLVHGHLDVVPAEAADWRVHPFSGDIVDGCIWGRGAIDMKDMVAMVLAVVREWAREGRRPERDIVLAFLADEEMGSFTGARWLGVHHPELFADCSEAISEVGGFSVPLNDGARAYMVQTAEKGLVWLRLTANGSAGHASLEHRDNAITALSSALSRIGSHSFPVHARPEVMTLLRELEPVVGRSLEPDEADEWLPLLGGLSRMVGASLRNSANPTRFDAGYKNNVVPATAEATIDARFLPGYEDELMTDLGRLVGDDIDLEVMVHGQAVETTYEGALVDAMCEALRAEDPHALPVPYLLTGGTDAKVFAPMGIRCFGFAPLLLPDEVDFTSMFHGVDERVPISSVQFGVRVLDRLLSSC
jgi:acetylornithine deacetylase/succinyl-diaminopimelate desuccinylase-like protein